MFVMAGGDELVTVNPLVNQEQRSKRNSPYDKEIDNQIIQVPRAARYIIDRVEHPLNGTVPQGGIESGHAFKRQAGLRILQKCIARHTDNVEYVRAHDSVIDIADYAELCAGWRYDDSPLGMDFSRFDRIIVFSWVIDQFQVNVVPDIVRFRQHPGLKANFKITLFVCDRLLLEIAEACSHHRMRDLIALETLVHIDQIGPQRVIVGSRRNSLIAQ